MRAFGWRMYDCSRFYCGGFLDFGYAFARNDIGVRLGFIRLIAITTLLALEITTCAQPIKPSPSGEGGLPKRREGKTDEGKTTIILL